MKVENIFDEVGNFKARVEKEIMRNQELLKLVSIKSDNPLSEPDIVGASSLVDDCILFKPKVFAKTIQETQSFLMTDIAIQSVRNRQGFADIKLIFRIMVHNTLIVLHDDRSRVYEIASRLYDLFANEKGSWIGKCSFEYSGSIEAPSDYQAIQVVFSVTDFKG